MGQQQLLLFVLGIVIVGLAVVIGLLAFGEGQKKANAGALVDDGLRIASDIQAWARKPKEFGGPTSTEDLGDATFEDLSYTVSDTAYVNSNGSYSIAGTPGAPCVTITGTSINGEGNKVYVRVTGTRHSDIETAVNPPTPLHC